MRRLAAGLKRTAVIATVNNSPAVRSLPSSVCGSRNRDYTKRQLQPETYKWYAAPTNGSSLFTGNSRPNINSTTTYYSKRFQMAYKSRIAVTYGISHRLLQEEVVYVRRTSLDASVSNMVYLWSPGGETTQTGSTIGNYSVTIILYGFSCDRTSREPNINSIAVIENSIAIQLENPGYFEYSIGIDFQALNQFSYIPTGQYTFVRDNNGLQHSNATIHHLYYS
jgi:hypothetical protein